MKESAESDIGSGAQTIKLLALRALAAKQTSANGRNYYLTQALETEGLRLAVSREGRERFLLSAPLRLLFKVFKRRDNKPNDNKLGDVS